jgi:hypothetical protein
MLLGDCRQPKVSLRGRASLPLSGAVIQMDASRAMGFDFDRDTYCAVTICTSLHSVIPWWKSHFSGTIQRAIRSIVDGFQKPSIFTIDSVIAVKSAIGRIIEMGMDIGRREDN